MKFVSTFSVVLSQRILRLRIVCGFIVASLCQSSVATTLEEITVTASPLTKTTDAVNQPVAILSDDELHQAAASTMGETLNGILGVNTASFGPGVGLPIIRGQSDNRVKMMQDSVGTMDAASASPDHAITIEPLLTERIEVLRGPASLRYGSGAIGGVVNVLDNRIPETLPTAIEGGFELRHATVNEEQTGVLSLTSSASDHIAWHLDSTHRENNDLTIPSYAAQDVDDRAETTRGYIANTDARSHSHTAGLSYIAEQGFIGIAINTMDNNYGIPPGTHEHHDEASDEHSTEEENEFVRIDMQQTRYDFKGEINEPFTAIQKITTRIGRNDYEHTEMENGAAGTKFTNQAWEGRIELLHKPVMLLNGTWQGAVGVQASDRTFAAVGDEAFIPTADISNQGIFFVEETTRNAWTYEIGIRTEQQRIDTETNKPLTHPSINFSASALRHITDQQRVSIGIAQSQRAPSVEELLANGPHPATQSYLIGNTTLDVETSHNLEIGYHWHGDGVQSSINFFRNQIDDFIYAQASGSLIEELAEYQYTQTNATFSGAEAEATITITDHWEWRLFGDSVSAELANGEPVPRIPPARYGSELGFTQDAWTASLRATHTTQQEAQNNNEPPTGAYTRVDARVSYSIDQGNYQYLIFLKGTNLLDEEIRNATSFLRRVAPEGGRGWQLGIRVNF